MSNARYFLVLIAILLCSCCSSTYQSQYKHLDTELVKCTNPCESDYFLVLFVDAKHLDYSDCTHLFRTIAKHPNGSKTRDVGHAWIYLQGKIDGQSVFIEGGHSGELGIVQAKYFDGIMNYIDYGYATPKAEQMQHRRYEPNPIKYLWETLSDGFFQEGNGKHKPTMAAKINLNEEQFFRILSFIQNHYLFSEYSITGNQCTSFVTQVAALAGLSLECDVTLKIEQVVNFNRAQMILWKDPCYSEITFSSPDILEKSLIEAIVNGVASSK